MTIRVHVALAVLCGLLVLSVEALATRAAGVGVGLSLLVSSGLGAQLGLLIGLAQGAVAWGGARIARRVGLTGFLERATDHDPAAPREPVVLLHAAALAMLAAIVVYAAGLWLVLGLLLNVADMELHRRLTTVVAAGGAVPAGLFGVLVARLLLGPIRSLDRRFDLPRPHGASLRYAVYVAAPATAILVPALLLRDALGAYAAYLYLALFFVLEGQVYLLIRERWPSGVTAGRRANAAFAGAWIVLFTATLVVFEKKPAAIEAARGGDLGRLALALLRNVTDVDRDGASSLYGGGDCAPFNPAISPLARDIPGNGIDENCDGVDATPSAARVVPERTFHGQLDPALVKVGRYNIVWVIVDAVRADRCSMLGYGPKTTPYLEELAKDSLVFTHAYSQSSATMLSVPSMLTGRIPGGLSWKKKKKLELDPANVTLAERLSEAGYRTGLVTNEYMKRSLPSVLRGYDVVEDTWLEKKRGEWARRNGAVAATLGIHLLERNRALPAPDKPFFLTVYSADPHDPYDRHSEGFPPFGESKSDLYDGEIAFADRTMGFLVDYLRFLRPVWDHTVFIFSTDHGEEFGEHGGKAHASTCFEESTHVPLLIRIPGVKGARVDARVANIDVVPTLIEVLGIDKGAMQLDGQSLLVPLYEPRSLDPERPIFCSVVSQKKAQGDFFRQSIRVGSRSLMHDSVAGLYALYDTAADPREQHDISAEPGEQASRRALEALLTGSLSGNLLEVHPSAKAGEADDADTPE